MSLLVASIAPILLFSTAIATLFIQQRNLRRENDALRTSQDSQTMIKLVTSLQQQAQTNYQDARQAEERRQQMYDQYLHLQELYAQERSKTLGLPHD